MDSILLSIRPEFIRKIESGEKVFEFRRRLGKNRNPPYVFVYETAPVKAIVGYFKPKCYFDDLNTLWQVCKRHAGITEKQFRDYFAGLPSGYAFEIIDYREIPPFPLKQIGINRPPQSFMYLNRNQVKNIQNMKN